MNTLRKCLLFCSAVVAISGCGAETESTARQTQDSLTKAGIVKAVPVEQSADGTQVQATLRLSQGVARRGDKLEVTVELKIAPLWEIHSLNAQPDEMATKLELITPPGIRAEGEWIESTTTRSMSASGRPVHVGRAVFTRALAVDPTATIGNREIACQVIYQVCNERQCLKPKELTLQVPLTVRE